ncbi:MULTISPECIES: LysR family transcriptional regulator [Comamonas]|uniref:LysR family transcriptional regulator n=1 Tax=Comamonas avium TaxID=2762231 RepID=A0ABR8S971_9BURK|nr:MULTISPECIES: LysR family transcriptional regulator [Comamonas]MBD7959624.1 LysR family transcriptional regulator [Comamonas avium]
MSFPPEQVPLFLAVLDTGSFSAAARKLGRVPSAISMAMGHLEAELGLQLFDRTGREPQPTAAARALEPQARLLAQQLQQLNQQALALHAGLEKRLTLAIAPELLATAWAEHLQPVVEQFPALVVEVLVAPQADALELLHAGRAQLALVFERPSFDAREDFQEQGAETLVAVMSTRHPLWTQLQAQGGAHIDMAQLAASRQILVASRDPSLTDTRFVFSHHLWRADSHGAARSLIAAGLCWGWLPHSFVEPHIHSGELVQIPLSNLSNGTRLFVDWVWSKERPLGLAAALFVQQLQLPPAKT